MRLDTSSVMKRRERRSVVKKRCEAEPPANTIVALDALIKLVHRENRLRLLGSSCLSVTMVVKYSWKLAAFNGAIKVASAFRVSIQ